MGGDRLVAEGSFERATQGLLPSAVGCREFSRVSGRLSISRQERARPRLGGFIRVGNRELADVGQAFLRQLCAIARGIERHT